MLVKLEWLGYRMVKKLWRYVKAVFILYRNVTDRQTDGWTDRRTDGQTERFAISISRVRPPYWISENINVSINCKRRRSTLIDHKCMCLQAYCPPASLYFAKKDRLEYDDLKSNDIRWNFEKFLIDRRGVPVIHYSEKYLPHDIESDVRDMLMTPSFA